MKNKFIYTLLLLFLATSPDAGACTIFSAIDSKGQVWAGNNEDNVFNFNSYFHTVASTPSSMGYIYFTNSVRSNEYPQGGVNEAGLFYDSNSVPPSIYKDYDKKKVFPGGPCEIIYHILKTCKTVPEVLQLFKEYRQDGLEGGQLHFADADGNLGIIVADSMWITKATYQVSTNYNRCHPNKDGIECWRYPIAEGMLKSKEAGFETFKEICDSSSQTNIASTVYSNIHNLNTGKIWLYYGGDFSHPYETSIRELLKKGNSSFRLYELFADAPLVATYKLYQSSGMENAIQKLNTYDLSARQKNELGRLLCYDVLMYNHDFKSYPFLADFIASAKQTDELMKLLEAYPLFFTGHKREALEVLQNYKKLNPKGTMQFLADLLADQMNGKFEKDSNISFELKGCENASYVFVEGLDFPNIQYFLIKENGKWTGKFKLQPGEYEYYFLVDGKRMLDAGNKSTITVDGLQYSKIIVKDK